MVKVYDIIRKEDKMIENNNLTSKDKDDNILVNGEFKICNIPAKCSGTRCDELCIMNQIIRRLYEFEHGVISSGQR